MKCCMLLTDGILEMLPFERTIATGYYDGPTEGFTECSQCGQAYSFRKLDWDDLQDVRIFGFAPLNVSLDTIAERLGISSTKGAFLPLVPPLQASQEKFVNEMLAQPAVRVAAVAGWPGQSSLWRDIRGVDLDAVGDWFSFLGIPRRKVAG
jgi:hypothetical protein